MVVVHAPIVCTVPPFHCRGVGDFLFIVLVAVRRINEASLTVTFLEFNRFIDCYRDYFTIGNTGVRIVDVI